MWVEVKDVSIYCEIYGTGIPIIMLHGWSPDHRIMKGCMEPLFKVADLPFKRVYFDLPGMGQTKGREWITGSEAMLDLVEAFIEKIIPGEKFLLAGESYGGYLARGMVKRKPEVIEGLLLLCPLAKPETQKSNSPAFKVLERDQSLIDQLNEEERSYFESITVVQRESVWRSFKEDILPGLKLADWDFLFNSLSKQVPFDSDVDDLVHPFLKPTLMLTGRQDSAVGYSDLWGIIENYPRASFVVLDKAGHNLQIEQPAIFNLLVKEWLERVVSEITEANC